MEDTQAMKSQPIKDEITDLLKELDLNIDADVAFLAAQNPPIKVFPKENTTHLAYNEQVAQLEADYLKHYTYRGDLKYNEKMARRVGKKGKGKCGEDETCMYRVCRDKNRFYESRIKDDALILGKILESMIERTSEMEKDLEKVLRGNGEKTMPDWDALFEYEADYLDSDGEKETFKDLKVSNEPIVANAERKAEEQQSDQSILTHDQAQMLVAQIILSRSFVQPKAQWSAQYFNSIAQTSTPSTSNGAEQ